MQVICDNCDEIYFNRIFDLDATVEHPQTLRELIDSEVQNLQNLKIRKLKNWHIRKSRN